MIRILIPCWNYSDYLEQTIESWVGAVPSPKDVHVITAAQDIQTLAVAQASGVSSLVTDSWTSGGASLNKAAALDSAVGRIKMGAACLCVDADCRLVGTLPPDSAIMAATLYGCRRFNLDGVIEPPANLPYITSHGRGDAPEACGGYFQLFRRSQDRRFGSYPTAAQYDYDFAFSFPKAVVLGTCHVVHLGTRRRDWAGRGGAPV